LISNLQFLGNGVTMVCKWHILTEFGSFESQYINVVKLDPYCLRQKCSPKNLVFGNM